MARIIPLATLIIALCSIASISATEHSTADNYSVDVLKSVIASNRFVLLLVYNRNAVVCKEVGLHITELEQQYGNRMYVIRSDTTRNRAIYNYLQKLQTPYIDLYVNGQEVDHFSGCLSKQQIQAKIDAQI